MEMDACVNSDSTEFRKHRARTQRTRVPTATHDASQARPPILFYPWSFRWTKPGVQPQVDTKHKPKNKQRRISFNKIEIMKIMLKNVVRPKRMENEEISNFGLNQTPAGRQILVQRVVFLPSLRILLVFTALNKAETRGN